MYLFIQESLNRFRIKVVKESEFSEDEIEKELNLLVNEFLSLNEHDDLNISFVKKIPRKTRKLRKVISNIKLNK